MYFCLGLDKHKPTIRSNLQNIIENETKKKREKRGGERELHYKVYQNRTSALPQFCQLAVWRYSIGLSTELVLLLQKFRSGKENVTKEKW